MARWDSAHRIHTTLCRFGEYVDNASQIISLTCPCCVVYSLYWVPRWSSMAHLHIPLSILLKIQYRLRRHEYIPLTGTGPNYQKPRTPTSQQAATDQ